MRTLRLPLASILAACCAACGADPGAADRPVPPATTDADLMAPANVAADNASAIPVVPDPPAR
jgi:hypothetical protein